MISRKAMTSWICSKSTLFSRILRQIE